MTGVPGGSWTRFLVETGEAAGVARRVAEGYGPEEFMDSVEARYALRYALLLVVESLTDSCA